MLPQDAREMHALHCRRSHPSRASVSCSFFHAANGDMASWCMLPQNGAAMLPPFSSTRHFRIYHTLLVLARTSKTLGTLEPLKRTFIHAVTTSLAICITQPLLLCVFMPAACACVCFSVVAAFFASGGNRKTNRHLAFVRHQI